MNERHWNAFISYAHEDVKMPGQDWTAWVKENLTTYKTPEEFVGLTGVFHEPVPDSMPNVFLDRVALANSGKLEPELEAHLKRSRVLVVLCSPQCALSEHTAREVACFKRQGRERGWTDEDTAKRIIVLVLEGEPYGGNGRECYPPPLAYDLKDDGVTPDTAKRANPLYIDLRPRGHEGEVTPKRGATTAEAYERAVRGIYAEHLIAKMVRAYEGKLFDARIMLLSSALGLNHSELNEREILRIKEEVRRREEEAAKKVKAARHLTMWVAVVAFFFIALSGGLAFSVNKAQKAEDLAKEKAKAEIAARKEADEATRNAQAAQSRAEAAGKEAKEARQVAETKQAEAQAAADSEKKANDKSESLLAELLEKCLWYTKESDATAKAIVEILSSCYSKYEPAKEDTLGWVRYAQVLIRKGDLLVESKEALPPSREALNSAEQSYHNALDINKRVLELKQPPDMGVHSNVANVFSRLSGVLLQKAANPDEAPATRASELLESIQYYQSAHSHYESEIIINSSNSGMFFELALMSRQTGIAFTALARIPEQDAKKYLGEAVTAFRQSKNEIDKLIMLFPSDPQKAVWEGALANVDQLIKTYEPEAAAR